MTPKEVINLIQRMALAVMDRPVVEYRHADGTMMNLTEMNAMNTNTAFYNKGIQDFADRLIEELIRDET